MRPDDETIKRCHDMLSLDMISTIKRDPMRRVLTPGWAQPLSSAASVVHDQFATPNGVGDTLLAGALSIIARAADSADADLADTADAWLCASADLYADYHVDDLLNGEE